ncbi:extracellular solute-binding protein [Lichenihabitans psoromatis]|uniref:extracellular solute-binding protein n=1 Tax=Lichenihabitans psoromatis TaxID=2528642 RepID=UPI00103845F5|nr:extracellular solute-binding protein [Lichenihabitans psoromatis]
MQSRFIAAYLVAAATLSPHISAFAETKQMVLYNWSNYMSPDLLKRFEAETGIAVTLDTYDTNESMLAKIQAGGGGYDVVVPTGPTVQAMIRDGLVLKLDASTFTNYKNIKAPFDHPDFDPARAYSVPYMWGTTAIAYNTAKVTGGKIDNSWKELFEPRPELVGKIGMLKDSGEVFGAAAYYLGYDYCTADPKEGQKILELLEKQKPAVKVYNAEGTVDRVASGEVAMQQMWNGSFHRAHKKLPTVAYVFPKEGVNLWGDNLVIPKGAKNVENAKIFLNWMLEPKNAAEATNFTGYNNAITGSDQFMDASLKDDPAVNVSKETIALFRPVKDCSKAALDLRDKIWTRLLR